MNAASNLSVSNASVAMNEVKNDGKTENAAGNAVFDEVEIALQIPSDAEFVRVVRLAVMGVASRMPFSYDDIEDIKLAVSEACNNAILHARVLPEQAQIALGADASGVRQTAIQPPVVVRLMPHSDRLEISVEDGGRIASPGLLVRRARKPVVSPDEVELPEGGVGLFLIQSLMDEVQHLSGDNSNTVIHMTKLLPRRETPTSRQNSSFAPPLSPNVAASAEPIAAPIAAPEHSPAS